MRLLLLIFASVILCTTSSYSQKITHSVISSYGTAYNDGFIYVANTVGETVVATFQSDLNFYLTQGFHQPPLRLLPYNSESNTISIGPNPVTSMNLFLLNITFEVKDISNYTVEVYSILGVRMDQKKLTDVLNGQVLKINLQNYSKGTYIVHVFSSDGKMILTEKIEKL
ncbi:MAG: T9SS type A sorting domain-containing protein [Bacteroidales bacterium]|nr:T9SS type A sorting domain-containing protein [Bacteroidales bacterium]